MKMDADRIDLGRYCVVSIWFGCNNQCDICMLSGMKDGLRAIGFEQFRKVLADIARAGRFTSLILSGAEVTTFDELEKYVQCAASLGYFRKIQIQTNGRRLSDNGYFARLTDSGVNEFFISIHGCEEVHDATTRIPGSFRETLGGLENACKSGANVISNTVLTRRNLNEIVELTAFLCREGVSEIHLWNYFPMSQTDDKNLLVSLPELLDMIPALQSAVKEAGRVMVLKSFPLCLHTEAPLVFDSVFPVTVLPDRFWREFGKCGFGRCFHREAGTCRSVECWGLSSAYLQKYGDERNLLKPLGEKWSLGVFF